MTVGKTLYRWWPSVVTGVVGLALASGVGTLMGSQIHDHDLGVIVRFVATFVCGIPVGAISVMVWWRRNPW